MAQQRWPGGAVRVSISTLAGSAASKWEEGTPGTFRGPQQPGQHVLFEQRLTGELQQYAVTSCNAWMLKNDHVK